jgi:penicillin-insensitive murein DD-endopeptidase
VSPKRPRRSRLLRAVGAFAGLCLAAALSGAAVADSPEPSRCFGTPAVGSLANARTLPLSGPNFQGFSGLAASLGRTHVHSTVEAIVSEAYAALAARRPELRFVYGEASWPNGGRLAPHRTHQNGTSVDFFVPVRDAAGRSLPLPTSPFTRFGYDLEFDAEGRLDDLRIDFEALAEHLYELHRAAGNHAAGLRLVILDTRYLPLLERSERGRWVRRTLNFLPRQAWVRHDEHYHIDFDIPCAR